MGQNLPLSISFKKTKKNGPKPTKKRKLKESENPRRGRRSWWRRAGRTGCCTCRRRRRRRWRSRRAARSRSGRRSAPASSPSSTGRAAAGCLCSTWSSAGCLRNVNNNPPISHFKKKKTQKSINSSTRSIESPSDAAITVDHWEKKTTKNSLISERLGRVAIEIRSRWRGKCKKKNREKEKTITFGAGRCAVQSKIGAQRDDPSEEAVAAILQFRAAGYPQKKKKQKNTQKTHKTTSFPAFIDQGIQKKKERLPILRPIRRQRRYKSAPLQIRDHYSSADFIMIFFCRGDSFSVPSPKKSVLYFLFLAIFIATWMARKETWATAEQEKAEKKNQRKIKRAHRKKKTNTGNDYQLVARVLLQVNFLCPATSPPTDQMVVKWPTSQCLTSKDWLGSPIIFIPFFLIDWSSADPVSVCANLRHEENKLIASAKLWARSNWVHPRPVNDDL